MGITWDINLTTILVFCFSCIIFYVGVLRMGDKATDAHNRITVANEAIEEWKLSHLALRSEFTILKDDLHKNYVPRLEFDAKMDRLFDRLEQSELTQLAAINRIDDRLIQFISPRLPIMPRVK